MLLSQITNLNKGFHIAFLYIILVVFCLEACDKADNKIKSENIKEGRALFSTTGCATCHSLSGDKLYGPALDSLYNTEIWVLRREERLKVKVERAYLKKSLLEPDFEKPLAYVNSKMPKPFLTEYEIECLVDYLISQDKNFTGDFK